MNVNDYFERIFNPEDATKKVDFKVFLTMVETNDYTYLIQITLALSKLILGNKFTVSLPKLLKVPSSEDKIEKGVINQNSQQIQFFLDTIDKNQALQFLQGLLVLQQKLKNTIYEHKISAIIQFCAKKTPKAFRQDLYSKNLAELQYDKFNNKLLQQLLQPSNLSNKFQDIIKKPSLLNGKFSSSTTLYSFIAQELLPWAERYFLSIAQNHQRYKFVKECLQFLNQAIHQFQLEIIISKNTLIESRVYNAKVETQILIRQQKIIDKGSKIINEAILCPSSMEIQLLLFHILRRMYFLWGGRIKLPLFVTIKNISLYSQSQSDIKQVAMFIYKIMNEKSDLQLSNLLNNCQQLQYIKQSKFFSSKAYAYSNEISQTYDTNNLNLPFWHYYVLINSQEMFHYSILIQKVSSLIVWQFYLLAYDVRFGIYKVETTAGYSIDDYQNQKRCKQILKLEKVHGDQKQPIKGMMFLKNGLYHLVIDNTFSLIRSKEIVYMFTHLTVIQT